MSEQTNNRDAMKLPLMNNAIPGTVPRSWLHARVKKETALICLVATAVIPALSFPYIDYRYQTQAQEIHRMHTERHPSEGEAPPRRSVYEELTALRQEGLAPQSWAVDFFRNIGADYYLTKEGFERKR